MPPRGHTGLRRGNGPAGTAAFEYAVRSGRPFLPGGGFGPLGFTAALLRGAPLPIVRCRDLKTSESHSGTAGIPRPWRIAVLATGTQGECEHCVPFRHVDGRPLRGSHGMRYTGPWLTTLPPCNSCFPAIQPCLPSCNWRTD